MKLTKRIFLLSVLPYLFSCTTNKQENIEVISESTPKSVLEVELKLPETKKPAKSAPPKKEGYQASEELYNKTFKEIEAFIAELNSIISRHNYSKWKHYLSPRYIETYNNPKVLADIANESDILKENNIKLLTLKDYFDWVVVPSRSKTTVDEIVFSDKNHITVYTNINNIKTILYQLEKKDDKWTITV